MASVHKARVAQGLAGILRSPRTSVLLAASALVVGLAALLPLLQSSDATSVNGNIQRLRREKADWQARLHELQLEVAALASLERVEQEATQRLGMVTPQEIYYLPVDAPPPEEHRLPSRFLPPPAPKQNEPTPSLWEKLFGWLPWP